MIKRWKRTDYLKFHVKEWDYELKEVQANFNNDIRQYIAFLVNKYPGLARS